MFRAYCYMTVCERSVRLTSEALQEQYDADSVLLSMQTRLPNVTGGGIEQNVPGIGWVLAEEAETAVVLSRRASEFGGLGNVSNGFAHS